MSKDKGEKPKKRKPVFLNDGQPITKNSVADNVESYADFAAAVERGIEQDADAVRHRLREYLEAHARAQVQAERLAEIQKKIRTQIEEDLPLLSDQSFTAAGYRATMVQSSTTEYDLEGMEHDLGANTVDAVTDRKINIKKVEKLVMSNVLLPDALAQYTTTKQRTPYLRIAAVKGEDGDS